MTTDRRKNSIKISL